MNRQHKKSDAPTKSLVGRKALVMGANICIGQGVAEELARQGADVAFCYLGAPGGAQTKRLIERHGQRAAVVEVDLTVPTSCEEVVDWAVRELGGFDRLVNNAGVTIYAEIEKPTSRPTNCCSP
jgi:NAD(P)-dependent dehydrogenase (short-subunit alcohol dehydrogenase family)